MSECERTARAVNDIAQARMAGGAALTGAGEANEARDIFLANISHELRTPLNGLLGMADLLARTELTADQRGMLDALCESGETLARRLSDVLDQADIVSGRITLRSEPFELGEMVRTAVRQAEGAAARRGVGFKARIEPSAEQTIMGDADRLRQILASLIDNAASFTDRGAVSVSARIDHEGVCRIVVSDAGVGVHPAAPANIFDGFRQGGDSGTRRHDGLGLALARQLADVIGARLECRSGAGLGSAFVLTLPVVGADPLPSKSSPPADALAEWPGPAAGGSELSVLVVDDHHVNRELLKLALMPSGVRVVTAENGAEACDLWTADRFDLVVMDLQMPVMDGLTAIRRIRAAETSHGSGRTPIVVFTANATDEQKQASFHAGADHFLTKPLVPSALMATFQTILQSAPPHLAGVSATAR